MILKRLLNSEQKPIKLKKKVKIKKKLKTINKNNSGHEVLSAIIYVKFKKFDT